MIAVMAVAVAAFACSERDPETGRYGAIVVDPTITRAGELDFDAGDAIGLTVVKQSAGDAHVANAEMTYDGALFRGDGLLWYYEINDRATLRAYYPYDSAGEPSSFTVRTDQSGDGYTLSDFMTSVKTGVLPSADAVDMVFGHRLTKLNIVVADRSVSDVVGVSVSGVVLTADVDVAAQSAAAAADAQPGDIEAHTVTAGSAYCAVIVPQSAAPTFTVRLADGSVRSTTMRSAEFAAGRQYTATLTVTDEDVDIAISGRIEGWGENTDLVPDTGVAGDKTSGAANTVSWGGADYPVAELADGRTWMVANLRYVPAGGTVSSEPGDGTGVWYPCDTELQAVSEESFVAAHGYVYDAAAAAGGSLAAGDSAVRGICPDGWHLPARSEFEALAGAYADAAALTASPFGFTGSGYINAVGKYAATLSGASVDSFWSSTYSEADGVYCFKIQGGTMYGGGWQNVGCGAAVRCVMDE